ncbi:hypothetical protein E4198_00165 [Streptomyces sp. RKND-216]|uniref:hypothetical protein n=1 Tax=Streptomyces sp. RKND-216 TaxID=2562581 RepID=UPI00109DFCD0|nr:hypothetical protein [Streptomyces sp. RKND-216]THA28263.1 hypothetical protein E4198_00165 [Streptomyces sp. RKND-216]
MSDTTHAPSPTCSAVAALIGDAKPATDRLLRQLAESVRDVREHDHPSQNEDLYCSNLTSWMGDRTAVVLRRLLDAEAQVAEHEAAPLPSWVHQLGDELGDFLSDLAPAAISYYDPETPDAQVLARVERAFAVGRDRARERLADRRGEPACDTAPGITVYRASYDSIAMGLYTTREAARAHCEAYVRREVGDEVILDWVPDDSSEDAPEELCTGYDAECTGYIVTPLTVAAAYDEEADE